MSGSVCSITKTDDEIYTIGLGEAINNKNNNEYTGGSGRAKNNNDNTDELGRADKVCYVS